MSYAGDMKFVNAMYQNLRKEAGLVRNTRDPIAHAMYAHLRYLAFPDKARAIA